MSARVPAPIVEMKLISRLRKATNLDKSLATDAEILRATEGTFLRARIELGIAWSKLWEEICNAFWQRNLK